MASYIAKIRKKSLFYEEKSLVGLTPDLSFLSFTQDRIFSLS
jgi:hypothetical protein